VDPDATPFTNQACDRDTQVLTCGMVETCPGITRIDECADGTVCRASGENASCLSVLGWYADLGGSAARSSTMLIGHPITVTNAGTLARIGLIVKTIPAPGVASVKMGVYSGADGSLQAAVESTVSVGPNELTPASMVPLVAGGTYWVFAVFSVDNVYLAQTGPNVTRRTQTFTYGNTLPASMNGSTSGFGPQSNYYLLASP
jgi:hypothetical protein